MIQRTMHVRLPALAASIAIPLVTGIISSWLTKDAMVRFGQLNQPPLSPPAWLFPVAWSVLYILMGVASYLIFVHEPQTSGEQRLRLVALVLYALQLAVNFAWSPVFFGLQAYWVALAMLVVMWAHILALVIIAFRLNPLAGACLVPYLAWSTFAGYLNAGVALLN